MLRSDRLALYAIVTINSVEIEAELYRVRKGLTITPCNKAIIPKRVKYNSTIKYEL